MMADGIPIAATISTHAPAGGATPAALQRAGRSSDFYSRPCGRGDLFAASRRTASRYFYSRPCGRGDKALEAGHVLPPLISTHAPAGGATGLDVAARRVMIPFLLTPLREGRPTGRRRRLCPPADFYSRPCGRGDSPSEERYVVWTPISTHAPAGGATQLPCKQIFSVCHFYSRPCGRGDKTEMEAREKQINISTHAPAGGATRCIERERSA